MLTGSLSKLYDCEQGKQPFVTRLYCIISRGISVYVPAGCIMWERHDNKLRVGNDGRPLLVPYLLKREEKHIN